MLFRPRVCWLILFCIISFAGFSQQQWPGTFLWRITGKNGSEPSYLYGTIHLQDKRLFQFTDSLYGALEKVEGFALELDFNELMDTLISRGFRDVEDELLEKQHVDIDKKKFGRLADSLMETLGIQEARMTKKDLKKIRDYRINKIVQQGEMQTIVDGYLYGLAQRLGKWMGGIEDVSDQLDLIDEIGGDLSQDEVFQPEKFLRKSLEELIRLYVSRDLQSLADYVDGKYNTELKDRLLNVRNIKMARRMDSLTALRSMFFGVGVAHLPGDSGVITLLRKRGFTVEPVFSPQSFKPEQYASHLNTIPWKKIDDDKLFSVEMPGNPSDYNIFGEAARMKVFFDLPTMTFYMAGHSIAGNNNKTALDDAIKNMAGNMGVQAKKIQAKNIIVGDCKGKETFLDIPDGSYRVQLLQKNNVLYILMAGTSRKSNLNTPDVTKFFASFNAKDVIPAERKWAQFSIPGKGFSVKLPGTPKPNLKVDGAATGSNWNFTTYDLVDEEKGFYYLIQVREIRPGFYLEGDSSYFTAIKENLGGKFDKILSEEKFMFQDWPALKLVIREEGGMIYKFLNIMRGNRVYCLIIGGGTANSDFSEVNEVLNSMKLEPYEHAEWKQQSGFGFITRTPGEIKKVEKDSLEESSEKGEHFVCYNPVDAVCYEIFRTPLSRYYWARDDTSFFAEKAKQYTGYKDSVLEKRSSRNGGLKGIEMVLQKPGNTVQQRVRMFVNGDSLYTLVAHISETMAGNEDSKKFFSDFRVNNETKPSIYTKKTKELMAALQSTDSAELEDALGVFESVAFEKEDLPQLHQALLYAYQSREENYRTIHDRLIDQLEKLADTSTIDFISNNYNGLIGETESIKYHLLKVLANMKTQESYSVLKKLLRQGAPGQGNDNGLSFSLRDSLELTLGLYPEILELSKDSTFSGILVNVTRDLLDSNLISIGAVLPYRKQFLTHAKAIVLKLQQDEDEWWGYRNWVAFLGWFNDPESNEMIRQFLALGELDAHFCAVVALVKNGQLVPPVNVEKLAADNGYRKDLYDEFKKMNLLHLFPEKYHTQAKLAESEIYLYASDEEEPSSINLLGERRVVFKGKKQRFYLFKISYEGDEHASSYLGITGPYPDSKKNIVTETDGSGIYWDEEYDKKKTDEQLKKHLAAVEDYINKKE